MRPIISKGNYTYLLAIDDGYATFRSGNESSQAWNIVQGTDTISQSQWYHLAGTFRNGRGRLYINGFLVGSYNEKDINIGINSANLTIGCANLDNNLYFDGIIDEPTIYGRVLLEHEIYQNYLKADVRGKWTFDDDEGGNIASDTSENDNHGTLNNMDTNPQSGTYCWIKGRIGQGVSFDGSDDYIDCGNDSSLDITEEISIEAWINPNSPASTQAIACKGSFTYYLGIDDSGAWFRIGNGNDQWIANAYKPVDSWSPHKWYHIVGTYKKEGANALVDVFIDGEKRDGSCIHYQNIGANNAPLTIGSINQSNYFHGEIDEVNIYSRALNEDEIQRNFEYHGGKYGFGIDEHEAYQEDKPEPKKTGPIGGGYGYSDIITYVDCNDNICITTEDDPNSFKFKVEAAENGQIVFIEGDVSLDLSRLLNGGPGENLPIEIPGGVILASNRGETNNSKGALIKVTTDANFWCLKADGDDVRITGIRLEGPSIDPIASYVSQGISCNKSNLEVDNCEIYHWTHAGIQLWQEVGDAHIHHNHIHHCRKKTGLGYGAVIYGSSDEANIIELNKFDNCRICVASARNHIAGYEARFNLVAEQDSDYKPYWVFDLHSVCAYDPNHPHPGGICGYYIYSAGNSVSIHHNEVKQTQRRSVGVSGIPHEGAEIYNNWFQNTKVHQTVADEFRWNVYPNSNFKVYRNIYSDDRQIRIEEDFPPSAVYTPDFTCPACVYRALYCDAPMSLLTGKGSEEPNGDDDNTIDGCSDGTGGNVSVESIRIKSIDCDSVDCDDYLAPGVYVQVECSVYGNIGDYVTLWYTTDITTIDWGQEGDPFQLTKEGLNHLDYGEFETFYLDGYSDSFQAIRIQITTSEPTGACYSDPNADRDDLVFYME